MKKIILLLCLAVGLSSVKAQSIYFQAQVKKSASGTSLEFYIRPNPAGPDITLRFDNLDFFVRWPISETAPLTGTPVVNTTDFPGLTINQQAMDNPYTPEAGYKRMDFSTNKFYKYNCYLCCRSRVPCFFCSGNEHYFK